MEIPTSIQATANAIQRGQVRFDRSAALVVADTEAMAQPADAGIGNSDLATDLVGLDQDRLANAVLFGVFSRQQAQQAELANLVRPVER